MTALDVMALRHRLGVERSLFARVTGADTRTVTRWEKDQCSPSGASLAVMTALQEALDTADVPKAARIAAYVVRAAQLGGLSYLMVKLLNDTVP